MHPGIVTPDLVAEGEIDLAERCVESCQRKRVCHFMKRIDAAA